MRCWLWQVCPLSCAKDDADGVKTRAKPREWKCVDCRANASSKSSVQSTLSDLTKEFLMRVMEQFKTEVFDELKTLRLDMSELSTSVKYVSDSLDASNKLMADIREELASLKKENQALRERSDDLTTEIRDLKERLRSLEQYTRKNNVEVSGIPVTVRESVLDIVKYVGAVLGVEIKERQVAAAH